MSKIKKYVLFFISVSLMIVILNSCTGQDGNASLKYWWANSLLYIFETNPSTPQTIYNDVYFQTNPGSFYMEYTAFNNSSWYIYYTITIDEGQPLFIDGDDIWFEIGLYSTGPVLYEWDNARIIEINLLAKNEDTTSEVTTISTPISSGKLKTDILGSDSLILHNGKIDIQYGKILNQ